MIEINFTAKKGLIELFQAIISDFKSFKRIIDENCYKHFLISVVIGLGLLYFGKDFFELNDIHLAILIILPLLAVGFLNYLWERFWSWCNGSPFSWMDIRFGGLYAGIVTGIIFKIFF